MKRTIKVILIFIVLVILGLAISILTQPKGEWVCEGGQWVKLGNPKEPMPGWGCGQAEEEKRETKDQKPAGIPLEGFQIPNSNQWNLAPAGYGK